MAAESIGRETVQYVSNIYKYYLAYQMLTDQEQQRPKAKGGQLELVGQRVDEPQRGDVDGRLDLLAVLQISDEDLVRRP